LLARIDPARFRFVVRNAPAGDKDLGRWLDDLKALLVVNGSFYAQRGTPETPLVSAGALLGPRDYDAKHGAFVTSPASVGIRDLAFADWRTALRGADDAVVSYPLLLASDGSSRAKGDDRWLANRSFVAQDRAGRIVVGDDDRSVLLAQPPSRVPALGSARSHAGPQPRRRSPGVPRNQRRPLSARLLRSMGTGRA
jgi:hypothetical protein